MKLEKKHKILMGSVFVVVLVGGLTLVYGGQDAPVAPPYQTMMFAKHTMQKERAKLGSSASTEQPHHDAVNEAASTTKVVAKTPMANAISALSHQVDANPSAVSEVVSSAPAETVAATKPELDPAAKAAEEAKAAASLASNDAYYKAVANLHRQIEVLQLKSKIADLSENIAGAITPGSAAFSDKASPISLLPPPMSASPSTDVMSSLTIPLKSDAKAKTKDGLVSVMTVAGRSQAVIRVHGAMLTVTQGSQLSNGWQVQRIGSTSVRLIKGHHHKTLHIGG